MLEHVRKVSLSNRHGASSRPAKFGFDTSVVSAGKLWVKRGAIVESSSIRLGRLPDFSSKRLDHVILWPCQTHRASLGAFAASVQVA